MHLAKYTRGACGHMLMHYDRSKNLPDNIDPERTHLNYNLAMDHITKIYFDEDDEPIVEAQTQHEFLDWRLANVRHQNRSDINVLCDWVVTMPRDFYERYQTDEKRMHEFFSASYDVLEDIYGAENVVSAYVHMDETTPHMHFAFMPIVWDGREKLRSGKHNPNYGQERLSAKDRITRQDLQRMHPMMQKELRERLNEPNLMMVSDEVMQGHEPGRSVDLVRLKGQTRKEIHQAQQQKLEALRERDAARADRDVENRLQTLQKAVFDRPTPKVDILATKEAKTNFRGIQTPSTVTIRRDDFERLQKQASVNSDTLNAAKKLTAICDDMKAVAAITNQNRIDSFDRTCNAVTAQLSRQVDVLQRKVNAAGEEIEQWRERYKALSDELNQERKRSNDLSKDLIPAQDKADRYDRFMERFWDQMTALQAIDNLEQQYDNIEWQPDNTAPATAIGMRIYNEYEKLCKAANVDTREDLQRLIDRARQNIQQARYNSAREIKPIERGRDLEL